MIRQNEIWVHYSASGIFPEREWATKNVERLMLCPAVAVEANKNKGG